MNMHGEGGRGTVEAADNAVDDPGYHVQAGHTAYCICNPRHVFQARRLAQTKPVPAIILHMYHKRIHDAERMSSHVCIA